MLIGGDLILTHQHPFPQKCASLDHVPTAPAGKSGRIGRFGESGVSAALGIS